MCTRYRELHEMIKSAESEKKELGDAIVALLKDNEIKTLLGDIWQATVGNGCHVAISKEKLASAGVALDIIERCTSRSPYNYPVIGKRDPNAQPTE